MSSELAPGASERTPWGEENSGENSAAPPALRPPSPRFSGSSPRLETAHPPLPPCPPHLALPPLEAGKGDIIGGRKGAGPPALPSTLRSRPAGPEAVGPG